MSTRAAFGFALLAALAPKMPEQCNKVLKKAPATTASAEPAPPPPPPPSTATAPPIWTPPEGATPAAATVDAGAAVPSSSNEYALARAAADKKDWKKVKSLLDKRVKSGRATSEEIELLHDACEKSRDKACLESLKKLAPPPPAEE